MPGDLRGVRLKLERAQRHRHDLDGLLQGPGGTGFFRLQIKEQVAGVFELRAQRYRDSGPVAVLLGDLVHNLRAALDHLVWQLVLANGGQPGRQHAFPLCLEPAEFARCRPSHLAGVADEPGRMIEGIQPYQSNWTFDRNMHPLWVLHALDVTDKHRLLNTVSLRPAAGTIGFSPDWTPDHVEVVDLGDRPIEDGMVVARIWASSPPELNEGTTFQARILIEENDRMPAVELGVLDDMTDLVTSFVDEIARFVEG